MSITVVRSSPSIGIIFARQSPHPLSNIGQFYVHTYAYIPICRYVCVVWVARYVAWSACKCWVLHPDRRPMRSMLRAQYLSAFPFKRWSGRFGRVLRSRFLCREANPGRSGTARVGVPYMRAYIYRYIRHTDISCLTLHVIRYWIIQGKIGKYICN
ncbi:hypothetical protein F4805DRAFT_49145 [Annulohypoxylon moriforme]|nr:hypothetical protein F4805DRAFT_49145 [Annulohypoxylon moriforme]